MDIGSRLAGTTSQVAYLIGDHRKAPAMFTGAGGFDGGVQGQQIGLFSNLLDDLRRAGDGFGLARQFIHGSADIINGLSKMVDGFARCMNHITAAFGQLTGMASLIGGILYRSEERRAGKERSY